MDADVNISEDFTAVWKHKSITEESLTSRTDGCPTGRGFQMQDMGGGGGADIGAGIAQSVVTEPDS